MDQTTIENEWDEIEVKTISIMKEHLFSNLRYGQALFNALSEFYPDIANKICGTIYDCFNDDTKVDLFKERVIELLNTDIQY